MTPPCSSSSSPAHAAGSTWPGAAPPPPLRVAPQARVAPRRAAPPAGATRLWNKTTPSFWAATATAASSLKRTESCAAWCAPAWAGRVVHSLPPRRLPWLACPRTACFHTPSPARCVQVPSAPGARLSGSSFSAYWINYNQGCIRWVVRQRDRQLRIASTSAARSLRHSPVRPSPAPHPAFNALCSVGRGAPGENLCASWTDPEPIENIRYAGARACARVCFVTSSASIWVHVVQVDDIGAS